MKRKVYCIADQDAADSRILTIKPADIRADLNRVLSEAGASPGEMVRKRHDAALAKSQAEFRADLAKTSTATGALSSAFVTICALAILIALVIALWRWALG